MHDRGDKEKRWWWRPGVIIGVAILYAIGVVLAACNLQPEERPTERPMSLEEIETAVAETLAAVTLDVVQPSDTPIGTPTSIGIPTPIGTPSPPPEATVTPVTLPTATLDLNAILAEAMNQLPEGRMLFNPPQAMSLGEKVRVELRVLRVEEGVPEPVVEATLKPGLRGPGTPLVEPLKVGTSMKAKLSGDGFDVVPLNEEEQIVAGDRFTQWAWDVTAIESGQKELNLTVTVKVIVEEVGEKGRDLPVMTRTVQVRINPVYSIKEFLSAYWQFLATALVLPIVAWAWRRYSTKKAEAGSARGEKKGGFE